MRSWVFLLLFAVTALPLYAHEGEEHAETVQHYAAPEIHSVKEAHRILQQSTDKILAVKTLDDSSMEAIHEQSYALEAALEYLRPHAKNAEQTATLDGLDESIQTIHYASENHDIPEITTARPQLKSSVDATLKHF